MAASYIPFALLIPTVLLMITGDRPFALAVFGLALAAGLATHILAPIAFLFISLLVFAGWLTTHKHYQLLGLLAFTGIAASLLFHLAPGFRNPRVFDHVRFAADSIPFTMYLNFDKITAGLFICYFFYRPSGRLPTGRTIGGAIIACAALAAVFGVLAPTIGFVRWNPKIPAQFGLWMLNNFFFVCLAEEAFFRVLLQDRLLPVLLKTRSWITVVISAALFGLAHYQGGWIYVALAAIAGLVYGFTFHKTRRLELAMLVHFGLNATHFFLFSYPASAR